MLAWYHEDGTPHLCDIEACEAAACAFALLEWNDRQVVVHFCEPHLDQQALSIMEVCKDNHTMNYHVNL